LDWHPRSPLYY